MSNDIHQKLLASIGKRLTDLRIKKGYPVLVHFTNHYRLPPIQYRRIEKGLANITLKSLNRILIIHGLTIDKFFNDQSPSVKPIRKKK
jgi:hypothetical protein